MRESAFNFESMFRYTPLPTNTYEHNQQLSPQYSALYSLVVFVSYVLLIITFPFSALFCLKRIHSLKRCVVFRLGRRLPLKGPGLIITFPCIDLIDIIDLSDQHLAIVDSEQQLLTSDGSIIRFNSMTATLNVMNAIRSSTQLKDAKFNCEQFVKLSFINMMGSTHVEDFENKTETILKQFEQNSNTHLNNWGWNLKIIDMPKYVVMSRANPINPIMNKIKGLFNSEDNNFLNNIAILQNVMPVNDSMQNSNQLNDQTIISSLELIAKKYSNYVFYDLYISIETEEIELIEYFVLNRKEGKVHKIQDKPNQIHININAKTVADLMQFCNNQDTNRVNITSNLF